MKRRLHLVFFALVTSLALVACQPPRDFGPNVTDTDLWDPRDIRVDTEVPDQYPDGRAHAVMSSGASGEEGADDGEGGADH